MLHFKAVDCSSKQKANERRENKTPDAKVICIYCNNALLSERKGSSANVFTTIKPRTCLPTLKSSFDKNLKSLVVYKVTRNGCSAIYVGQTSRHVTTRFSKHEKKDLPVANTLLNVVGQRKMLNGRFLMHVLGLKN